MKMQWKIGQVEMQNPFILAPMAGVTDLPFRLLCKEQGAGLLCTEMVSAKAISFRNKNTISLMQIDPAEHSGFHADFWKRTGSDGRGCKKH